MRPAFLDAMSWEMAEVYGAITDQILVNLAHYFPYYKPGDPLPRTSFEYQSAMLAQMGKVNQDTVRIIRNGLADADDALKDVLEQAIIDGVRKIEPELLKAVQQGIIRPAGTPVVSANQMRAFQLYYNQSATKLNLVNTVMLESTMQAYQGTVSSIVSEMELSERMNRVQIAVDTAAGETITGVSTWNQAMRHGIDRLKENGITGFIDHAGRRWSAESYVAMDVRTTVYNTGRAAVWETNESFGNDLYIVSYHDGARPLCYPWQNKVISSTDTARTVQDLDGNEIRVYAQSETTYGQAAGLFGINCKHYPSPFIPGVSVSYDQSNIQDEAENEKVYEQTQEQRGLERKIREQKRDWLMAKAQNASADELRALRDDIRQTSAEIDEFCDKTGLPRRKNREGVYTKREFPAADTYDPRMFSNEQKKIIDEFFSGGGAQKGYTFGQMTPKATTTQGSANIFGETITFSEKMDAPKWDVAKQTITDLAGEFRTKLKSVSLGAEHAAGDVQISGTIMRLSSAAQSTAIHEFAHSISLSDQTKYNLYDEADFWKEIKRTRRAYRKAVEGNPAEWISSYEHSSNSIDEFMAEAFAIGYMREKGLKIPQAYGNDTEFSSMVLATVRKYFGK